MNKKIKYALIPGMLGLSLLINPNKPLVNKVEAKENNKKNNSTDEILNVSKIIELQNKNLNKVESNVEKKEKIVTDETKTADKSGEVQDIDSSILDERRAFIGNEDGSVSLSGNKEIASKENLNRAITVDEFNEKARAEKEAELKPKIEKSKYKIVDNQKETIAYRDNRVSEIIEDIKQDFQKDLDELNKYDGWMLRFSNINAYTDDKQIYFEASNNFNKSEYDETETYETWGGSEYTTNYRFANRKNYKRINKDVFPFILKGQVYYDGLYFNSDFKVNEIVFDFAYKDSDTSDEFKDYIEKSNLIERLNNKISMIYNDNYAKDRKYLQDKKDNYIRLYKEKSDLEYELEQTRNKKYAKITEEPIVPKTVEIVKDDSIWNGNFRWERYSEDGYIKTLYQNGDEIAKRVQHPLVGIKRVGTKTEEVRERREVESATYDVIERPTNNKEENGTVIQEGSDGLIEKIYDATYDKYSNIIKKELKDTIVKKEQKDRIVLRYGIKKETRTPVTLYDGIKNYNTDEKKIKDYNPDKRYKDTQMEQGAGTSAEFDNRNKENEFIDGYRYKNVEPSPTSPDRTKWGIEIEFNKEKGQRTYTNFGFTNSGNMGLYLDAGTITAKSPEDGALGDDFKTPNYKATTELVIDRSVRQINLHIDAAEEDLKRINSIDNNNTIMAWEGHYKKENTLGTNPKATEGDSALFSFSVNPWPDENDKLNKIKLNGTYDEKVYVKGQDIKTKIKVDNLDENARERLVGQVYNPVTGEVVKEADAYIDDEGFVHIKMPDGVINEDGTENKNSIFNTPEYRGLQNLDVKFFARPRTKAEFEKIIKDREEELGYEAGFYTETGAGSKFINHKGKEVEVDLQGIDRYDHYNLIGSFKLQLDDTRYYDQNFLGSDNKDTTKHTSIPILPGQDFTAKVYLPEEKKDNPYQKSDLDIKDDAEKANLVGKLDKQYIEAYNKGKKDVDKWTIKDDDITKFTITAPKTAKAGDFMAIPIEYTYTNGSKDTHWFHFVVQGTENNVPSYQTKVGYQGDKLVSDVTLSQTEEDLKKNQPLSYELADDEYIDSEGNRWTNVTIDPKTGQVTATVPKGVKINGGEILTVNVIANYKDEYGIEKQETVKAEFVARPKYDGKFTYTETQELPFDTEIKFDDSLKAGEQKVTQEGEVGEQEREITQTYENDKMSDQVIGDFKITKEPKNRIITVGSKTDGVHEYKEEIPFKYTVKEDPTLGKGKWVEDVKGVVGSKTTKWTIVNSKIVGEPFIEEKEAVDAVIRVGTGSLNGNLKIEETNIIQYETKVEFDDTIEHGKIQTTGGEVGEKKRNVNLTIVDGEVTKKEEGEFKQTKAPVDKIIKVGSKTNGVHSYEEEIPFNTKVEKNPELKKGEWRYKKINNIEQTGKLGKKKISWTIENSKIVGKPKTETIKEPVDAIIEIGDEDFTGTITHQVKEEKAFDVEIVENPNMIAGTSNIKQKGVKGEVITEYSQKIKNGEADGEMTSKEISNKAPVKQIIEVGTKPANNDKDITNETNVKIEYVYDNTLDKGVVKNGELIKGKVTTKVVNEYNPKTGQIETVEKTVVEDAVQKIIVGTKDYTGEFKHTETQKTEYDTEIVFDNTLKEGESVITQKGELGEKTREITQTFTNGKLGEKKVSEYTETKKPVKQIIKVGSMTEGEHSHTEKIPFKYNISYDSNLKSGEYVIDIAGKEGEKTTVWNIKNSKVTGIKSETTTEPIDAVIRVGNKDYTGKFEHTEKFRIPYSVEVRTNPDLPSGQYKTIQEGKEGLYSVDYLQKIKNGQPDGELKRTERNRIEAKNHIIEIGIKPAKNDKNYSKDVGIKVEYVYDNTKDKGVVEVTELKPGKVETRIVNKYDPSTGKITTTEEEVVTEAYQKIVIGTKDFTGKYKYEHTEKIPFEVEVRKDPTLKKGESKVLQKGEAGEKYYKYSQNIKNGQADGERKTVEEKTTKEAVKEIILVGTGAIEGETTKVVKRKIPFETKIIYDENLETGNTVVENEGKPGEEEVTITTKSVDGEMTQTEDVKTISKKEDRVVRIGIKPIEREIETGFNTIYKHNKDLKDGEFNTITEGVNGRVVTKIFFNKETGKIETKEEKIDPIDKVVEYGSKTEGKVKVESDIPFEIEVIKDDTLKAGEVKVDQEGELGKKETIITIENSKEVDREENVIKAPIKKIVRVGTKCDDCCKPEPDNKDEQPKPNKPEPDNKDKKPNPDDEKKPEPDKPQPDGEEEPDPDGDKDKPNPDRDKDKPEPDNKNKKPEPDKEKPDNKDKSKSSEKDNLDKEPVDEKIKPVNKTSNKTPTKKEATNSQTVENKKNVRTGVSGMDSTIVAALLASVGLAVTGRKKKED